MGEGATQEDVEAVLLNFVRHAQRPCTEEELLALLPAATPARVQALVDSRQLETEMIRWAENDEQRMYWVPAEERDGEGSRKQKELDILRTRVRELDEQIAEHSVHEHEYDKEIAQHMDRVHEYNELKDIAQALMGRLATIEGVLTRDLYKRYGLNLED